MTKHLKTLIFLGGILLNCAGVYGKNTITGILDVKEEKEVWIINDNYEDNDYVRSVTEITITPGTVDKNWNFFAVGDSVKQEDLLREVEGSMYYYKKVRLNKGIHKIEYYVDPENKDWSYMFSGCNSLIYLDLSQVNTEGVENMECMFEWCSILASLDLRSFNTQNVIDMSGMFGACSSLINLDLSSFNTKNVKNMSGMFCHCNSLTSLDLSSFDTKKVEDMSHMFFNCSSLINLDLSSFDTKKVEDMSDMFSECRSLTNIDLSSFNTQNVKDMRGMFERCRSLTSLDLSSFNTQNVEHMKGMFRECSVPVKINKLSVKLKEENSPNQCCM